MPPSRHSRYIFEKEEDCRIFRHERFVDNITVNCETCQSSVGIDDPISHHWMTAPDASFIELSMKEKLLLKRLERNRVESYLLCDESAVARTNDFLLDAGMDAVPQLLRFLFYEATRLEVSVGFYVNITQKNKRMYFESSCVSITHFLDIEETIDMLFSLLLEKIGSYLMLRHRGNMDSCTIKRLKLTVKRYWTNGELKLPIQYQVKSVSRRGTSSKKAPVDLALLTESYLSYKDQRFGQFPSSLIVNLYCFRVCASSRELYVVPYLLNSEDIENTPTFVIQNDVTGEFRGMHEIYNVRRFLRPDLQDHTFVCRVCKSHFADRTQFALHRQINCGREFVIWNLDDQTTELHANCLALPKEYFKYAWYGLGK